MTLEERCRTANSKWLEESHNTLRPLPSSVYHYTCGAGLHGILSSNTLRGSNFAFMNDRSAFSYGIEMVRTKLLNTAQQIPDANVKRAFLLAHKLLEQPPCDVYLTCFCEASDLLSQWRGY